MAWQTPDTKWGKSERLYAEDFNRISGNLNFLAGNKSLPTNWTANDLPTLADWRAVTAKTTLLMAAAEMTAPAFTDTITASAIQSIERATVELKKYYDIAKTNKLYRIYAGQVYAGMAVTRG